MHLTPFEHHTILSVYMIFKLQTLFLNSALLFSTVKLIITKLRILCKFIFKKEESERNCLELFYVSNIRKRSTL